MNSEELELSLRNEFESHLKNTLAEMRQEIIQFQEKFEAEFESHKNRLNEVFQEFTARIAEEKGLDEGFTETVVEHLRLARDEGSKVAVAAMEKAEAMQAEAEAVEPKAGISELCDAISDISSKNTQSSILKTLVHHAAQFTPRGAFFIIKNEHLVGWRVFGKEGAADEQAVREVFFPVAADTVLGESVRSLSAVESSYGTYSDDSIYLNKLDFGHPDRMLAVPLVVRGRGVAVLYADNGSNGEEVNIEALETLARVAGLTVEILASARSAKPAEEAAEKTYETEDSGSLDSQYVDFQKQPEVAETEPQVQGEPAGFVMTQSEAEEEAEAESPVEAVSEAEEATSFEMVESSEDVQETEDSSFETAPSSEYLEEAEAVSEEISEPQAETEAAQFYEPVADAPEVSDDFSIPPADTYQSLSDYQFETDYQAESDYQVEQVETPEPTVAEFEETPFEPETESFEPAQFEYTEPEKIETLPPNDFSSFEVSNGKAESPVSSEPVEAVSEPATAVTAPSVRSRFSDRNVDLPIEVGEEERRLHNDARRFARLLVSEIKLYNEQKVKEGREASDLYERLREAIDRSREMYDKRVQPPVAARFDYFHYEIVSTLAEGDENKLGASYPGANV